MIRKIKKILVAAPARTAAQVGASLVTSTDAAQKMLWRLVSRPDVLGVRAGAGPLVSASGALTSAATTYSWLGAGVAAFSPSDLANLQLWLKADAITGLNDGDEVATWADSGPGGRDATAVATARATYQTNELNGKPILRFDGSNDTFTIASFPLKHTFTAFIVQKAAAAGMILEHSANAGLAPGFWIYATTNESINARNAAGDRSGWNLSAGWAATSAWQVITCRSDGTHANHDLWLGDDAQSLTDTVMAADMGSAEVTDTLYICGRGSASLFHPADVAEIIIYNAALATADRQSVIDYLQAKYAL